MREGSGFAGWFSARPG